MIANDRELAVTLDRIAKFQRQASVLRASKTNPANYHASVSGFLSEIAPRPRITTAGLRSSRRGLDSR